MYYASKHIVVNWLTWFYYDLFPNYRKALASEEEEYPDPDDMIDEWSVAEDGKSSRLVSIHDI